MTKPGGKTAKQARLATNDSGKVASRHAVAGAVSAALVWLFWQSRPEWTAEMRLWRAVGDAAFMLLFVTLVMGPMTRLWKPFARVLVWRRYTGMWFALLALVHGLLILDGWARWSWATLLGYEFVPQLGRDARLEPGFGLANIMGLAALFWALILAVTSFDRAVQFLGGSAWKWLHQGAHTIFYLSAIHAAYFLFIHYTLSFHRVPPPPNWFRVPLLLLVGSVIVLQGLAFGTTVRERRRGRALPPRERTTVKGTAAG